MARQMKDSGIAWIGEIPADWRIHTAFQLFSQVKNKNVGMHEDNLLSLSYGRIIKKNIHTTEGLLPESFEGYNIIKPNDIVLRLTDLQNDHTSLRVGISEQHGIITSAYLTLRNESDCFERYLYYQLHAFDICKGFYGMGAGVRQGLNWDGIKMLKLVRPSLADQHRIADFLDRRCAEIDAVMERTKATIEEYKKLKQAVITEAVTKGVRGPRKMKDSGIEWIGEIPEGWIVGQLGKYVSVHNGDRSSNYPMPEELLSEGIPFFTSFDIGEDEVRMHPNGKYLSREKYLSMSGYKAQIGDIVFCLRGSIGKCAVNLCYTEGTVASSLMGIRCESILNKFAFNLLVSNIVAVQNDLLMNGTCAANLSAKNVCKYRITVPPEKEQAEIAAYLDEKCSALDTLIARKTTLLTELEAYKKSLIYEYVTGKKECPEAIEQAAVEYPYFPAAVNTKKLRFAQAMLMAKVLDKHGKGMGRVKLEKMLYTIETSIGFDFDTEYMREAAGPLHESIYKCEGIISRQNHWYQLHQSQYGVSYTPTKDAGKYHAYYDKYFAEYDAEIERIIGIFKPYSTDQAEIVATLFAAWNDAIIEGKPFTDKDIVDDVLNNWHESKKRFPKDVWLRAMEQMRKNNLIPKGYGKRTVIRRNPE